MTTLLIPNLLDDGQSRLLARWIRRMKPPQPPWCFIWPWSRQTKARAEVLHWFGQEESHDLEEIRRDLWWLGIDLYNPHEY